METQAERDVDDCVVAICPCGRVVMMAVAENLSDECKRELGDAAAEGCDIKHMPAEAVRKLPFGCQCEPSHNAGTSVNPVAGASMSGAKAEMNWWSVGYDDSNHGKYAPPRGDQKQHDDYVRGHNAAASGRRYEADAIARWVRPRH